ncbi:trypsin-like [Trichoplusia ni]|uniref:Trypsin-like n=1 Tax=Trichoplusia ni TaxID=7111 RepID=A0A7E5WWJ3_TRINI|nr:trypsin-like [Trichoplusia ni]
MPVAKLLKLISFVYLICGPIIHTKNVKRNLLKKEQHLNKSEHISRVFAGRDLAVGEYPFVIVYIILQKETGINKRFCTGTMITATWSITAAHCNENFIDDSGNVLKKYVAYDNFTESPYITGLYVPIMETFNHPAYKDLVHANGQVTFMIHDIALFRSENVPVKAHAVLLAADYSTLIGLPVVYVGGGRKFLWVFNKLNPQPLQLGEATIINCDEIMKKVSKHTICLAPKCSKTYQTNLYGDSGGPLIYDGKVIGVASSAKLCKIAKMAYTPVSPYLEWIYRVVNGKKS